MKLYFTPGSPFARIIRVLLRELELAFSETRLTGFPPPESFFAVNPLGQVPALETDRGVLFPTRLVIDFLLEQPVPRGSDLAASVRRDAAAWQDEQVLSVLLAMGDALAAVKYQHWSGLGPVETNRIGFDPAERHMVRVMRTLDWLEARATPEGFLPDVLSVQDIALSCFVLWTEARGEIAWRGRPNLEMIVSRCSQRQSFSATVPQPWP